jgi:hypothetical protein
MSRVSRVKMGFKRQQHPVGLTAEIGEAYGQQVE